MSFAKMDGNFINQTVRAMKILRDFTAEMMKRRRESRNFLPSLSILLRNLRASAVKRYSQ